jgi:Secretion system C-terminal sorting domain/Receptor L domain
MTRQWRWGRLLSSKLRHQFYLVSVMKKLFFLLIGLFLSFTSSPQSCLPEGIIFSTQAQIDNFHFNYPNCKHIEGYVLIAGGNINNFNGLNDLTSIGGFLQIGYSHSLKVLSGLNSVTSIGGNLVIFHNTTLTSLTGLEGLTSIVGEIWIQDNSALTSLTGLNNVTSNGGELYLESNALTSLTGLEKFESINGQLTIRNNNALTSLTELTNLKSIAGNLEIESNNAITTLTGLNNIDAGSISYLYVTYNHILSECAIKSICDFLANNNNYPYSNFSNNSTGCNSKAEVDTACNHLSVGNLKTIEKLSIYPNPSSTEVIIETLAYPNNCYLSMINVNGQELILQQITEPKTQIDISNLPSGVYFVRLTNDKTVKVGKIIKQ